MTTKTTVNTVAASACQNLVQVQGEALLLDDLINGLYIKNGYTASLLQVMASYLEGQEADNHAIQGLYLAFDLCKEVEGFIGRLETALPVDLRFGRVGQGGAA